MITDPAALWALLMDNKMFIVMILFMAYRLHNSRKPLPKPLEGERTKSVSSLAEFESELAGASKKDQALIVDFYAPWCPPCRTAAPIFGQMSIDTPNAVFLKVNVDDAKEVAQKQGVKAMPTFKLFVAGEEFKSIQGWNKTEVAEALAAAVAKAAGGD